MDGIPNDKRRSFLLPTYLQVTSSLAVYMQKVCDTGNCIFLLEIQLSEVNNISHLIPKPFLSKVPSDINAKPRWRRHQRLTVKGRGCPMWGPPEAALHPETVPDGTNSLNSARE